jgi:branched-chain amino acid transport system substrate-binding protein
MAHHPLFSTFRARTKKIAAASAALAVTAGALAACGSEPAGRAGGDTIVLGNVGTMSGPLGERYGAMQKAVQAWADTVNDNGGIGGRPVRLEVADDGNDPAKNLNLVKQMVEEKHVVAFVGAPAPNTQEASVKYLEDKGVPVIGGIVGETPWGESPILFPQALAAPNKARVLLATAASTGKHKYAFVGINTHGHGHAGQPSIDEFVEDFKAGAAEEAGIELVYEGQLEPEAPDAEYVKVCQDAKAAGAEMMTILTDFNVQKKIIDSCVSQQYNPVYVTTGTTTDQKLLDLVGAPMEGAVGLSRTAPWMADQPEDLKVFRKAMSAHELPANSTTLQGWVSGRILEVAFMMGIKDDVTPANIATALRGIDGADLRGLIGPVGFGHSATEPNPGSKCYWLLVAKNGKWTPTDKGRTCLS